MGLLRTTALVVAFASACGRSGFSATDAPPPDDVAPPDVPSSLSVAATSHAHAALATTLTYPATVPAAPNEILIVSIHIGSQCGSAGVSAVVTVSYAGQALSQLASIVGTPCDPLATRSEQWQLAAPPPGTNDVAIVLAAQAESIHSGAIIVARVGAIRGSQTASGVGSVAGVSVPSAPGDLVVDTVGQGSSIFAPATGQTLLFVDNVSTTDTLDNAAASSAPGAGGSVMMAWGFAANDEWQIIATSFQP